MSRPRRVLAALAVILPLLTAGLLAPGTASAVPPGATYTVSVGSKASYAHPTDTSAVPYIDKDGAFYFQQSAALYGAGDPRYWDFFTGTNFDDAARSSAISDAVNPANSSDRNNDTTWRCNNSPTGVTATAAPAGSGYAHKNYCDLTGVWVDPDTGDWYGLVHNEFTPQPFGDGLHYDAIDYARSTNQGKVWNILGHAITSPYSTARGDTTAFPNQTYDYGDGDQRLFVDTASGYFYITYGSRIVDKSGGWKAFYAHAARSPISSKMAPGSWQKWYNGSWSQPGQGGLESNEVPVTSSGGTGYTPASAEYNPANTGSVDQQVAAGTMPPTSPLFVMDITYNAYLGLYIGEPQAVDQSGNAPQQIYATDNLATQKWTLIGDTGSHHTASWYRWFLDSANRTSSTVVGKNFRSYCSFGCSGGASGEYVNLTIDSSAPAPSPVDPAKTYTIGSGSGRVLAQAAGSSATTSVTAATGSSRESWSFAANGDGSFRITNAATGQLLGVDSASTADRAWATKPTATTVGSGGPTVGQQWFLISNVTTTGTQTGTYRLVNRYSGLVLGMSSDAGRPAETTPARTWTNGTGNSVGGSRTAAEQALTLTAGTAAGNLNGTHTVSLSGKGLDDPDWHTEPGVQLDTWSLNGGKNQNWVFTQQSDGSYTLVNAYSSLCADDAGGATAPGTAVVQWTCTGGANQKWRVAKLASGAYTITNVHSGLLLTTSSTSDGGTVTQQTDTDLPRQHWTIA
ncbi:RICIN domain-containing protein [Streptomyces sp. RKAG293]|uniref:RICIN domain-containing protein n=1 Tax=Streptomyces sp. RKAG293 TaxID=2893403 RepID=UPI0020332AC3|nr:RICIN domain-containing protein [Streptomyces sp. RKAG293]MCM2417783.1 RICIN domain-containing protein [Streptomyces sp. RKAG293]